MKLQIKKVSIIPLLAALLILLHYILANAVIPPASDTMNTRYLGYWLLTITSGIGTNLLALYLGYTATLTKHPWRRLPKIAFYLVLTGFISVIWGITFFQSFETKDLWIALFPISYNNFPFASSMLIWYVLGPILHRSLAVLSSTIRHTLAFFLCWFVIIMPSIYAKSLWGITDSSSFVWVGTLFIFGILISLGEFKWIFDYKKSIPIILFSLLLIGTVAELNIITIGANQLYGRFFSSHLINIAVLSIVIFGILIRVFTTHLLRLINISFFNWLAIVAYFISCLPIVTNRLSNDLLIGLNMGVKKWLSLILLYAVIMVISVILVTTVLMWLSRVRYFRAIIDRFTILEFTDLVKAPQMLKKLLHENWRILLVIFCGLLFTVTQMIITYLTIRRFSWALIGDIFVNTTNQLILNIIIFVFFFLLLFSIINRFWPALVFTSGVSIFISIAEFLKISLRDEPILPADLSMITALGEITRMLNPFIIVAAAVILVFLAVTSFVLQRHSKNMYHHSWRWRGITAILMLIFFSGSFWVNHKNSLPYIVFKGFGVNVQFFDQANGARINGPIIQFINNLDVTIMDKPAGYSKARIQSIMKKYNQTARSINTTRSNDLDNQTMVFVLSESLSDPNRVPEMKVSPNPMPYLTSLKQKTNSGLMLSSGYGGGTANMEWQSLTGLSISNLSPTLPTPYTQLVPQQKTAPAITNLFDSKVAIHPYNASLYNRKEVFKKFGFQKFYYQGSNDKLTYEKKLGKSPYISDQSAYKETIKQVKQVKSGSQFIQLSTMQNHMPYTNYYSGKKFKITGTAFDVANEDSVQTYVQGIAYTDKALSKFIKSIDAIKKPVTVAWYGDHLASLYQTSLMDKYPIQLHETDYFIYNNQTHQLSYTNRLVSPYSFSALALAASDSKVTPYYALITKVTDDLPAMTINPASTKVNSLNGSNIFVNQDGKEIKYENLSKKQKQLYHDYQMIQYDLVAGNQYSAKWAEQKLKTE